MRCPVLALIFMTSHAKHEMKSIKNQPLDDDLIAAASTQEWSVYFSNARVASVFLSEERWNEYSSGAHRFLPRMDAAPANAKQGVAPPSARWQQALMPKALFATSRGPAVNRYLAFIMPPSLALRKMDTFRELWRKTHDRAVLPVILADEFCEPILERELYSRHEAERWHPPIMRNYWDETVMTSDLRYLPLGPRHEFARVRPIEIKRVHNRKYLLSMMVSLSTSPARAKLEERLFSLAAAAPRATTALPQTFADVFIHNAREWQNTLPSELKPGKLVPAKKYREVLLDSVFSISPSGHNPETFRVFEAAESGSIPIVDVSDRAGACINPWRPFRESNAPFIWVEDWNSIEAILRNVTSSEARVREWQAQLLTWYSTFQRRNMEVLEQSLREHLAQSLVENQEARHLGTGSSHLPDSPPADLVQLVAAARKGGKNRLDASAAQQALKRHEARQRARHERFRNDPDAMVRAKKEGSAEND